MLAGGRPDGRMETVGKITFFVGFKLGGDDDSSICVRYNAITSEHLICMMQLR